MKYNGDWLIIIIIENDINNIHGLYGLYGWYGWYGYGTIWFSQIFSNDHKFVDKKIVQNGPIV